MQQSTIRRKKITADKSTSRQLQKQLTDKHPARNKSSGKKNTNSRPGNSIPVTIFQLKHHVELSTDHHSLYLVPFAECHLVAKITRLEQSASRIALTLEDGDDQVEVLVLKNQVLGGRGSENGVWLGLMGLQVGKYMRASIIPKLVAHGQKVVYYCVHGSEVPDYNIITDHYVQAFIFYEQTHRH